MEATAASRFRSAWLPTDRDYEGIGYLVGEASCQFSAHSAYIRCAVNPVGPCQECSDYESEASSVAEEEFYAGFRCCQF